MALLRPRQQKFVERSFSALKEHKNTLGVAPTGSGKSYCMSAVIDKWLDKNQGASAISIAHRDELILQNKATFEKYVQSNLNRPSTSLFTADDKSWKGNVVFSMIQTLSLEKNLKKMPKLDFMVIDEAHHAAAPSYRRVIDTAIDLNPDISIYGVTATAGRSDRKGLRPVFSNVADQIFLGETIRSGHNVPPKTFVIDVGVQEQLKEVKRTSEDFDMNEVAEILDHSVLNKQVVEHWKEKAGDRKTIVFCSTVAHANHVCEAFLAAGISAGVVDGDQKNKKKRKRLIEEFDKGDLQVLLNCFVLTEGFDSQPTSCVILLRPSSHKSTFIQMVGRGLRTVDPSRYPSVVKTECIILDFGISSITHGTLEQEVDLDGLEATAEKPEKECPECAAVVPMNCRECPLCGHVWEREERESKSALSEFKMTEFELLNASRFRWVDPFGKGDTMLASGFNAWVGVFEHFGIWYGIGKAGSSYMELLMVGTKANAIAVCDDFLNVNETESAAIKSRNWLNLPATDKQLKNLPGQYRFDYGLNRYTASCMINFTRAARGVQNTIHRAAKAHRMAC